MALRLARYAALGVCLASGLSGCLSDGAPAIPPTALELRGYQSREYDTTNTRLVLKAMLNVLQDMGFIVNTADDKLGLLTASKWTDVAHTKKEVHRAEKNDDVLTKTIVLECTANVSEFGQQSRVRVNFQRRVLDAKGATMEASPITNATFYQTFFAQVDKGIFLQQEGV